MMNIETTETYNWLQDAKDVQYSLNDASYELEQFAAALGTLGNYTLSEKLYSIARTLALSADQLDIMVGMKSREDSAKSYESTMNVFAAVMAMATQPVGMDK